MVTVQLPPPAAPFSKIKNPGESITLNTAGKVLVLPTGDSVKLPSFNEYVLNSNRLTIAESPFGGLKGSGSPDYGVGTIYTATDGIYITDTAGNNSTKTMTAGKLKELSLLTVSSTAKTITEEFVISNTNTSNVPTTIDNCNQIGEAPNNWSVAFGGTPTFDCDGSELHLRATCSGAAILIKKTVSLDLSAYTFLVLKMRKSADSASGQLFFRLTDGAGKKWIAAATNRFLLGTTETVFVLPIKATTTGTMGSLPTTVDSGFSLSTIVSIEVGIYGTTGTVCEFWINEISADVGKEAYIEIGVPDNLTDSSVSVQCWDGSAYQSCRTCKLDSTFADVSTTPANVKMVDGTKFDDVYGAGLGRGVFPKGISGATVTGNNSLTITYSANKGTKYRIGKMVKLPPYDGGRTTFNQIRLKFIIYYSDTEGNKIPDLSGNGKYATLTGLVTKLNVGVKPDGATGVIATPITSLPDEYEMLLDVDLSVATTAALVSKNISTGFARDLTVTLTAAGKIEAWVGNNNPDYINPISTSSVGTGRHTFRIIKAARNLKIYYDGTLYIDADFTFALTMSANVLKILELTSSTTYRKANTLYSFTLTSGGSTLVSYSPQAQNSGATSYEFADSTNASYGLQNLAKPWIALYDPAKSLIDFYLFTHRPKALTRKRNDSGEVYELILYPGNGSIFHGQITYANLAADTGGTLIPDCLKSTVQGSITSFLASYGMLL